MPAETVLTLLPGMSPFGATGPPRVAVAADGQVIGAWSTGDSTITGAIEVVEYRPSKGWSAPRTLTMYYGLSPWISLDLSDRGEAIVGWTGWRKTPKTRTPRGTIYSHYEVRAATRAVTGTWSRDRRLSTRDPRINASEPLVAITRRGQVYATWTVFDYGLGRDAGVEAATGSVSSGWRKRVTISRRSNGEITRNLWLAAANAPRAIIGWDQLATTRGPSNPTAWVSITRE